MKRLWIALLALLLSGCAIVPIAPYGYAPEPRPRAFHGYPAYPHHYYGHPYSQWQGR
jgi:starvation-inducible outer membrane lipoprotein